MKPRPWRVRVKRSVEDSIEVFGMTAEEAEINAAKIPGVIAVLSGMTILGEKQAVIGEQAIHIEDDLFGGNR